MENERGTHDSNFLLIHRNPQHVQGKKGLLRQKQECEESAPRTFPFPTALVVFCIVLSRKKTSFLRLLFFCGFPLFNGQRKECCAYVYDQSGRSHLFLPGKL